MRADRTAKVLCLLFFLAFSWPFLGLADRGDAVFGVPPLLLYVFAGWGILVAALAAAARRMGG